MFPGAIAVAEKIDAAVNKADASKEKSKQRRRQRKHRQDSKLTLGGVKLTRRVTTTDSVSTGTATALTNRKRSAASVAAGLAKEDERSQRQLPPQKRPKKK